MAWDELGGRAIELTESESESRRFGRRISRLTVGYELSSEGGSSAARQCLAELVAATEADVVIVRYPSAALEFGAALARVDRDVIPAGALTYWGADAKDVRTSIDSNGLDVVNATETGDYRLSRPRPALADIIDQIVASSFADYGSHYAANPLLSRKSALAGYQEWARRSLTSDDSDVLILRRAGGPVGFATCVSSRDRSSHLEILLAGLVQDAQGRGNYARLLDACARQAEARGLRRLIISTQVHNVRAQRAWARVGLRPFAAVDTVHMVRRGLLDALTVTSAHERAWVTRQGRA